MDTDLGTIHDFIYVLFYVKIFALFTKREGCVDIGQVVLRILIDPDKVEVIKNKVNKNAKNSSNLVQTSLVNEVFTL